MKTFNRSDVFSWANCSEARTYLEHEGYFANDFPTLKDRVEAGLKSTLGEVYVDCDRPFESYQVVGDDKITSFSSGFFLPAEKVIKAADKKYRPFRDIDEMKSTLDIELGDAVVHRFKKFIDTGTEVHSIFSSYSVSSASKGAAFMLTGFTTPCGLEYAFEAIEWKTEDGEWLPFGVEVEE